MFYGNTQVELYMFLAWLSFVLSFIYFSTSMYLTPEDQFGPPENEVLVSDHIPLTT